MSDIKTDAQLIAEAPESMLDGFDAARHEYIFSGDEGTESRIFAGFQIKPPAKPEKQSIPLTNVNVTGQHAQKVGGIWWIKKGTECILTTNASLPDSELMVMIERVVDGSDVIDDMRVVASIASGVVTMVITFESSGNYQITADRLNRGLERIGQPLELQFDKIEFDAYA